MAKAAGEKTDKAEKAPKPEKAEKTDKGAKKAGRDFSYTPEPRAQLAAL